MAVRRKARKTTRRVLIFQRCMSLKLRGKRGGGARGARARLRSAAKACKWGARSRKRR